MFKVAILLALIGACVATPAGTYVYTAPVAYAHTANSAVVRNDRLGGNFAYSVHTNPAVHTVPVVKTVATAPVLAYQNAPLAYSYNYGTVPVAGSTVYKTHTPVTYTYGTVPVAGSTVYKTAGVSPVYYNNLAYTHTVPAATHVYV